MLVPELRCRRRSQNRYPNQKPMNLVIPNLAPQLSFSRALSGPECLFLPNKLSHLSLAPSQPPTADPIIRMGGGPRTYPGGVSKWQWKRMQAAKAKQLLKARLSRERQMYEMRKRAQLKAAVSELERPWEVVERAPNLFSVDADEQVKVLADRFQKPGGFDMWTDRDGPQLFETPDELPSARFFPKGVVHSVRPYRRITGSDGLGPVEEEVERRESLAVEDRSDGEASSPLDSVGSEFSNGVSGMKSDGRLRKKGGGRRFSPKDGDGSNGLYSGRVGSGRKQRGSSSIAGSRGEKFSRGTSVYGSPKVEDKDSKVYDIGLQQDGSYGFLQKSDRSESKYGGKWKTLDSQSRHSK